MANDFVALYVAYTIVWAGVFFYLLYLFARQRTMARNMAVLKQELSKHDKSG